MLSQFFPKYTHSQTASNLIDLERADFFDEFPIRFLLSLASVVCLTMNLATFIRFKPPNHFKTNVALTAWLLTLFLQYKVLQLGKTLIMAPQRVYTIPEYGASPEHYAMKIQLYEKIEKTVKHIFTIQLISTAVLAISRDAAYTILLMPVVYSHEDFRFSLLLVFDFYLKLRKTPRFEKALCMICIAATFLDIEQWTWLSKIVPLIVYNALSFRILTSKL